MLSGSRAVMGGLVRPEFSTFQWGAMIMCTQVVGGQGLLGRGGADGTFPVLAAVVWGRGWNL
nr:hypothetical protein [Pseudophaeobacter profundi]